MHMLKTLLTDDGGMFSSRAMARAPNPLSVTLEFLLLAVGALTLGADSYIDRGVHKTLLL